LVAPEKPNVVDEAAKQCSALGMKTTKIASYLQGNVLPFVFLLTPAMSQVACGGMERQTAQPTQEPEDDEDDDERRAERAYEGMCLDEQRRGSDCPSKAAWYHKIGLCPDGTRDCQK
jgi:hypothetical protein